MILVQAWPLFVVVLGDGVVKVPKACYRVLDSAGVNGDLLESGELCNEP